MTTQFLGTALAGSNGTDPTLQIRERKFQSEDIVADLCLGAAITGVNTLIGIDIGLIIVICEGAASVVASVIRLTTAIFAPPRVDFATRLYWWRYLAKADTCMPDIYG